MEIKRDKLQLPVATSGLKYIHLKDGKIMFTMSIITIGSYHLEC